jgi:hypothetical protein
VNAAARRKATCKVFDVERMLLRHVHALTAVWLR